MKLDNVLISTKQTDLEYLRNKYDDVRKEVGEKKYEEAVQSDKEHYASLNIIRDVLNSKEITSRRLYMPYMAHEEFKDRDLVICVGGDGTVLNSARYILDNTPVLTVKSENSSVGALCEITASQFENALNKLLDDTYSIEKRARAEATFDNKTDLALNDISVVPYFGVGFIKYEVNFKGEKEQIGGSGIVISTGAGATGWYKKIGSADQEFSKKDAFLRFIARDYDYPENYDKYKLANGVIMPGEVLEIKSLNEDGEVISFDGDKNKRMHRFKIGHKIQIKISDKPLYMVTVNNNVDNAQRNNHDNLCL